MWFCKFFYQRVQATRTWTTSRRKEHGDYFRPNTFDYWFCTQDRFAVDARDHCVVDRLVVLVARRHGPRCWWTTSLLLRGGTRDVQDCKVAVDEVGFPMASINDCSRRRGPGGNSVVDFCFSRSTGGSEGAVELIERAKH
jgi:hypothetical protein